TERPVAVARPISDAASDGETSGESDRPPIPSEPIRRNSRRPKPRRLSWTLSMLVILYEAADGRAPVMVGPYHSYISEHVDGFNSGIVFGDRLQCAPGRLARSHASQSPGQGRHKIARGEVFEAPGLMPPKT